MPVKTLVNNYGITGRKFQLLVTFNNPCTLLVSLQRSSPELHLRQASSRIKIT
ncbi:MAG: hypothetical protein KH112_11995 [Sanguibacteroides justesenii]|uniref:hypothetical protein n=1 Tax=Butyricimonas faecalis TaxID=2093856 RepID=UPI001D588443|nr:hypothetical protein [Sanguibacteroides justesenii]